MFFSKTERDCIACGMLGFALHLEKWTVNGRVASTKYITHIGSGIVGAISTLASFCISAWRDAALRLPPCLWEKNKPRMMSMSLRYYLPPASSRESCCVYRAVPFSWTVLTRNYMQNCKYPHRRTAHENQNLTVRPASSKPSICSRAIFASSALLYLKGKIRLCATICSTEIGLTEQKRSLYCGQS